MMRLENSTVLERAVRAIQRRFARAVGGFPRTIRQFPLARGLPLINTQLQLGVKRHFESETVLTVFDASFPGCSAKDGRKTVKTVKHFCPYRHTQLKLGVNERLPGSK